MDDDNVGQNKEGRQNEGPARIAKPDYTAQRKDHKDETNIIKRIRFLKSTKHYFTSSFFPTARAITNTIIA